MFEAGDLIMYSAKGASCSEFGILGVLISSRGDNIINDKVWLIQWVDGKQTREPEQDFDFIFPVGVDIPSENAYIIKVGEKRE